MASLKSKGRRKFNNKDNKVNLNNSTVKDLPDKYLWMKVKSGTKIRNVLGYALKVFPQKYENIIWSGCGQAVEKVITCVELFKRKNPGLHQITKLHHLSTDNNEENTNIKKLIPEINIFLLKNASSVSEPEFQRMCNMGIFSNLSIDPDTAQPVKLIQRIGNMGVISSSVAEEFAAMGLRTGRKRSRKVDTPNSLTSKKSKNTENIKNPTEL